MTRLTNELRDSIHRKIMHGLPNIDYAAQIRTLIQDTIIEFAPKRVQELYANEATRSYLNASYVEVRDGNRRADGVGYWSNVYGLTKDMSVQMDERSESFIKEGTLYHAMYTRLKSSDLVGKHKAQEELRKSVSQRLKANLAAATTIKKLYEVLEPELHSFIPREVAGDKMLPACVAPVAEDLKKLGFIAKVQS